MKKGFMKLVSLLLTLSLLLSVVCAATPQGMVEDSLFFGFDKAQNPAQGWTQTRKGQPATVGPNTDLYTKNGFLTVSNVYNETTVVEYAENTGYAVKAEDRFEIYLTPQGASMYRPADLRLRITVDGTLHTISLGKIAPENGEAQIFTAEDLNLSGNVDAIGFSVNGKDLYADTLLVDYIYLGGIEAEEPTEPSEDPTEPSVSPTEPSEDPTEPSEDPTEPSEDPTKPSEDPTEPTEPEAPEYEYPDDWSRPALMFAVENGIFQGDANHNLNPGKNITRAEMAAVLTRLLGATGSADLSAFTDADPNAWYYGELSAAVAAGIFNGTTATTIAPTAPITREQAMVVLSRAFGIATVNSEAYTQFSDGDTVSEYARFAVGAMKELGLVNGYTDGSVKPGKTITRAEVAQLLFNLFDAIANTPEEITGTGRILYRGTDPLPEELTVEGTLILAQGTPADLTVTNWSIGEALVLRTQDGIDLDLTGLTTKQLVICAGGKVTSAIDQVWLGGSGVEYTGDATYLGSLLGSHSTKGNYGYVLIRGGSVDIDGTSLTLELSPNSSATLNSSCETVTMGQKATLILDGSCSTITMGNMAVLEMTGSCDTLETGILADATIHGNCITATMGPSSTLTLGGHAQSVHMGGFSKLIAKGHIDLIVMAAEDYLILDGTADKIEVEKVDARLEGTGRAKLVTIYARGCNCTLAADTVNNIWYDTYGRDYENALKEVQTMRVACTVLEDTFLCGNQNLTNYLTPLPKGAIVYNEWHPAGDVFKVSYTDKNGKYWQGWTDRWACDIPDDTITTNGSLDYSDATKEGWVDAKGYDSATDYLVWVSRYTQKVIVFQGSKGNWKVIKTMPCSSGANNTPTPAGNFTIYQRTSRWNFDYYYVNNVSIFNGGHAFHSILMNYDDTVNDDRVGTPLSHGCIRMLDEDCNYIYKLPMGTRVIVW